MKKSMAWAYEPNDPERWPDGKILGCHNSLPQKDKPKPVEGLKIVRIKVVG